MLDMSNDSHLFRDSDGPDRLSLYEAKMIHQFDHRWASYVDAPGSRDGVTTADVTETQKTDSTFVLRPCYWVEEREVLARIARVPNTVAKAWLAAHRADEGRQAMNAQWLALAQWIAGELFRREAGGPSADGYSDGQKLQAAPRVETLLARDYPACAAALREAGIRGRKTLAEFAKWAQQDSEVPLSDDELAILQRFAAQPASESRDRALLAELDAWMDRRSPRWLMGWRDITNATNERTVIASVIPRAGVGHKMPLLHFSTAISPQQKAAFIANLSSLVLDYVARQKVGGTSLTYHYFKQFPILSPDHFSKADLAFIVPRVLELTYTARDLVDWAADLGYTGEPFPWNPERHAHLRAELDACYARLYGLTRDELRYILDPAEVAGEDYPSETFRVLKNNEIRDFGEYRTRNLVLEAWERLNEESLPQRSTQVLPIPRRTTPYLQYLPHAVPCCEAEDWLVGLICDLVIQGGSMSEQDVRLAMLTSVEEMEYTEMLNQWCSQERLERLPSVMRWLGAVFNCPLGQPLDAANNNALSNILGDTRTHALAELLLAARKKQQQALDALEVDKETHNEVTDSTENYKRAR